MNYDWNFSRLEAYASAFLHGALLTVTLTALVVLIGSLLGLAAGLLLVQTRRRWIAQGVIDVVRAVPPLVLLLFFYYLLVPAVVGFSVTSFWVAVAALSLNLSVFTADVVRSAVENVPRSATDAGRALGMEESTVRRLIVLPHVARELLPAMVVLYIGMLKISSLASVIGVREVVFTAQTVIAHVSRSLEAWTIVACIYIALVVPSTVLARRLEVWAAQGRPAR